MERYFERARFKSGVLLTKLFNKLNPDKIQMMYLSASAFIEDDQERVLVVRRADGRGLDFPGGLREKRESLEQTAIRETLEETGYKIKTDRIITVLDTPNRDSRFPCLCFVFHAKVKGGELKSSNEGQPFWEDIEKLPDLDLAFDNHLVLKRLYRGY